MLKKIRQILIGAARLKSGFGTLEVATASSVTESLVLLDRHPCEAILTDFVLENGATGIEVILAIRAVSQRHTPAAILTQGDLSPEDAVRADKLGAIVFQKPIKTSEEIFATQILDWLQSTVKI